MSGKAARRHQIEWVRFQLMAEQDRPMDQAPLLCSCGEVTTSGEWDEHRGPSSDSQRAMVNKALRKAKSLGGFQQDEDHPWREPYKAMR